MRNGTRTCAVAALALTALSARSFAQATPPADASQLRSGRGSVAGPDTSVKEESSVTEHSIRINGQIIPYKATAGTIQIKN